MSDEDPRLEVPLNNATLSIIQVYDKSGFSILASNIFSSSLVQGYIPKVVFDSRDRRKISIHYLETDGQRVSRGQMLDSTPEIFTQIKGFCELHPLTTIFQPIALFGGMRIR